ncbi:MAG: ribonuclease catalytic domain-containing protein [Synechococcaceae cyanobacterium]|nr:ribonuclease catalytic domain-containing protein [Synechococcaceae cyanobacterium]
MPATAPHQLQPSDLVGLIEAGQPQLAVIQAIKGSRADLLVGPSAKPLQRPLRQLDAIAQGPDPQAPARGILVPPWSLDSARLAAGTPSRRDIGASWLVLSEQQDPVPLADFCELLGGSDDPLARSACWIWLQGSQTLFRWRQGRVEPRGVADLRTLRRDRHRQQLQDAQQRQWQELLRRRQPIQASQLAAAQQDDLRLLRQWACGETTTPLPLALRRTLQSCHCEPESGAIRHLLVDLGQWSAHQLPALENSPWRDGFSVELEAEAERLAAEAERPWPGDASRQDLSHLHSVTIDDEDTRDIDDGLALERVGGRERLWIHVADPGRLIAADSPLDREARRRASSLYLAQGTLPMLPAVLGEQVFSLRQGQRCAAWSLWVELNEQGAVEAHGLTRSWVRPVYRLSYADADELLELAPPQEDLPTIQALLSRRRTWRLAHGALLLDQAEGRIRARGDQAELTITEPSPSRLLVAEAMILAGAVIAAMGQELQLALPYRSQPPAELPSPAELALLPAGPVRHAALRRCLSRGHLGSVPAPHFSLGLPAYVQATSPIRRYSDLVVQRQLAALHDNQAPLAAEALEALLADLEPALREGIAISRDDQRHWQQVWFAENKRPEWRGCFLRWLRPQDQLGLVHLEELAMDLPAACPPRSEPGDALLVRILQVDPLRDLLRLQAVA